MSEWIEELEINAKKLMWKSQWSEGFLQSGAPHHIYFNPKEEEISISGEDFTIDQLQDLVNHMKLYKGE